MSEDLEPIDLAMQVARSEARYEKMLGSGDKSFLRKEKEILARHMKNLPASAKLLLPRARQIVREEREHEERFEASALGRLTRLVEVAHMHHPMWSTVPDEPSDETEQFIDKLPTSWEHAEAWFMDGVVKADSWRFLTGLNALLNLVKQDFTS